jgi:hypothetical protein
VSVISVPDLVQIIFGLQFNLFKIIVSQLQAFAQKLLLHINHNIFVSPDNGVGREILSLVNEIGLFVQTKVIVSVI